LILLRKRSADAYIRELDRRERRERKCHVVITGCDVLADVGIRAPLRKNAKASTEAANPRSSSLNRIGPDAGQASRLPRVRSGAAGRAETPLASPPGGRRDACPT